MRAVRAGALRLAGGPAARAPYRALSSALAHYTQVPNPETRKAVMKGIRVGAGAWVPSSVTSKSVRPRLHTVYTLKQVPQQSGPYCLQRGAARQAKHKTEDDPVRSARFRHGVDSCGLREDYRETQPRELSS